MNEAGINYQSNNNESDSKEAVDAYFEPKLVQLIQSEKKQYAEKEVEELKELAKDIVEDIKTLSRQEKFNLVKKGVKQLLNFPQASFYYKELIELLYFFQRYNEKENKHLDEINEHIVALKEFLNRRIGDWPGKAFFEEGRQ